MFFLLLIVLVIDIFLRLYKTTFTGCQDYLCKGVSLGYMLM